MKSLRDFVSIASSTFPSTPVYTVVRVPAILEEFGSEKRTDELVASGFLAYVLAGPMSALKLSKVISPK